MTARGQELVEGEGEPPLCPCGAGYLGHDGSVPPMACAPYRRGPVSGVAVLREGVLRVVAENENAALSWLLGAQPFSWAYAFQHGGWAVRAASREELAAVGDELIGLHGLPLSWWRRARICPLCGAGAVLGSGGCNSCGRRVEVSGG